MSNSEILGLHRITKKHLRELCKKHNLYQTPDLNDQLYLHFQGFQYIENLEEYTGLKCLWLESNAISEIGGLDCQSKLKCLFLQNNLIKKIENLQCCTSLDTLNLSSNHITKIENCGIDILPELSTLNLSRNYLQNSDAIRELLNCKQLWSLDLSNNRIDDILVVKIFAQMPELRVLVLQGNPVVSKVPQYRKTLILECKNLTYLDSRPVFPKDRACAEAWKRGGYEEERKEHDRWIRMDRKNTRNSVNATLRLRQKHGARDIQLLESSDDENDKKDKSKIKQIIPEDGTSSGDLEIVGVTKDVSNGLSNSADSSASNSSDDLFQEKYGRNQGNDIAINPSTKKNDFSILSSSTTDFSSSSESSFTKNPTSNSENDSSELEKIVVSRIEDQEPLLQKFIETETTELSNLSRFSEEEHEETSLNLGNDYNEKLSQENESSSPSHKVRKQNSTKPELKPYFKTDLQASANEKTSLMALVSKENEHTALLKKNEEISKSNVEDYSQENNGQYSSWWERTLAAARIEKSVAPKKNEDSVDIHNEDNEILNSVEETEVSQQADKNVSEDSVLENQGVSSNFVEGILDKIIDIEVEAPPIIYEVKENSQNYIKHYAEASSGSQNSENTFGDSPYSSFDPSLEDRTSVSTLREVITTFDEVVENVSSRQKSQLLKELIANPLTKTLSGQTSEQINRQVEELKQQKLAQLSNYVDYVCAQREKYDDTLDVVNGRLMIVKRSTGALEELPLPPLSQRTGFTNYTSCGVSTTPTSCNDDDGDSDSEDYGTALSEDNDNDDEEENDIEQHASDTKIKSIPTTSSDVSYCANESVSLSSAGSPTEIEKEKDNNYHHSDVVDDSQQSVARRLHNEIDSEVLPDSSKWLVKKGTSASVPADYKLLSKGGEAQTRSEFQVELEDSFQSFMDFGESAAALKDIALLFENLESDE